MCTSWKIWWLSLQILFSLCANVKSHGRSFYVVSAAGSIFSGRPYGVVLSLYNSQMSSSCVVSLSGPNLNLKMQYNLTPQDPCRSHQFQLPELQPGDYTLTIESIRGEYYKNSTRLNWESPKSFIKIQTPKYYYRPGELLRFRVLYFNEQLKPVKPPPESTIQIVDGNNNLVATYRNLKAKDGVYRGKFKLARNPVLGRWCLRTMNGPIVMGECAYFRVLQYVAPPFKVRLQTKRNVALTEKMLSVHIKAYYASENNVEGSVNLFVASDPHVNPLHRPINLHLTKRLISGKADFLLTLTQFEQQIPEDQELLLRVAATVNEGYTSDSANATQVICLYSKPFIVQCIHTVGYCRSLIANRDNSLTFRITTLDGENVAAKGAVKLIYSSVSLPETLSFTSQLKPNGIVNFPKVKIIKTKNPNETTLVFNTTMEYQGMELILPNTALTWPTARTIRSPRRGKNHGHNHRHNNGSTTVQAGTSEYIQFEVQQRFEYAICVVMSNGNVLAGHRIVPDIFGLIEAEIHFAANMWPYAHLFLYGMERNTLFVSLKTIAIQEQRNKISIRAPRKVSPGERITLNISTSPHSYVGLIATDEILFDLGDSGKNDLSAAELNRYLNMLRANATMDQTYMDLPSEDFGLVSLTNAPNIKKALMAENKKPRQKKVFSRKSIAKPIKARTFQMPTASKERRNFADVWLFDILRSPSSGVISREFVVPDSITTWKLNAFSMHSSRGLTVLDNPIYIQSSKLLHLSTNLPYSIKKGEVLRLPVTCFNQREYQLEVTLHLNYNAAKMMLLDKNQQEISNSDIAMSIGPSDFGVAFYYIKALAKGILQLSFTAKTSTDLDDVLHQRLRVVGETQVQEVKSMVYKQSTHQRSKEENLTIKHRGMQQRSTKPIKCLVTDQLIAIAWQNLPTFHPFDNAEESISKFLSSLYLWDYMESQQLLNATWNKRFEDRFNDGYQSMLRFRKSNGGFSYYARRAAKKSNCSSTWLTGFAMKALQILQRTKYIWDLNLLRTTKAFLMSRRRGTTSFAELCMTPTRSKMSDLELTLEIFKVLESLLNSNDKKHIQFWLNTQLKKKKRVVPARWRANHFDHWLDAREALKQAGSLLLLPHLSPPEEQFKGFSWLISKLYGDHNTLSCFESSVAQQGIYEYLKRNPILRDELQVRIYDGSRQIKLQFKEPPESNVHHIVLQNSINSVRIYVKGLGQVLLQCSSPDKMDNFNDIPSSRTIERKRYYLQVIPVINKQQLTLKMCLQRHNVQRVNYVGSVLELQLPTGYVLSERKVKKLHSHRLVRQAISVNDNTKLLVELKPLTTRRIDCLPIQAKLMHNLDNLQPGKLVVYDVNAKQEADILTYRISTAAENV